MPQNSYALVTGASSGIGTAFARELATLERGLAEIGICAREGAELIRPLNFVGVERHIAFGQFAESECDPTERFDQPFSHDNDADQTCEGDDEDAKNAET